MGLEFDFKDGQTPLDQDEIRGLKIKSISTQGELDEFEQLNIERALEWTIHARLKAEQILSEKFVKQLHKKMYGDVWKWAGEFRKSERNIGFSWMQIEIELRKLLDDTLFWIQNESYPPEEIAFRFKHRLVSIHCFSNGNGRHSRLMADIIIEKVYKCRPFSWNHSNMVRADEMRMQYIKALKQADNGDIYPLLKFARE
jgi:Fic-DOC domain mobile mystery protein B